ncbi:hypothetical protein J1614_007633 [Plenodomus biglobosus]|nr:hypothetical protein J1614_007633 [Plenodomus biglobosus]
MASSPSLSWCSFARASSNSLLNPLDPSIIAAGSAKAESEMSPSPQSYRRSTKQGKLSGYTMKPKISGPVGMETVVGTSALPAVENWS